MKIKYSVTVWLSVAIVLVIFLALEMSYESMTYVTIWEYNQYESRTFLNSFYGIPKLLIVIYLFAMYFWFFAKILHNIEDRNRARRMAQLGKPKQLGKYEVSASPEVWARLPQKYRDQILAYYERKKKEEGLI